MNPQTRVSSALALIGLLVFQRPSAADQASSKASAAAWVARTAAALGGEEKLRSIDAVEVSGLSMWHQREQSERPEGPWFATFSDFTDVRNIRADAVRRTARVRGFSAPDWIDNKEW